MYGCLDGQKEELRESPYRPPRMMVAPAASTSGQPEVHLTLVSGLSQMVLFGQ